jgi:hypothetical protein
MFYGTHRPFCVCFIFQYNKDDMIEREERAKKQLTIMFDIHTSDIKETLITMLTRNTKSQRSVSHTK